MKQRTILLFIVIPLVVLLTVLATVVFHYRSLLFSPHDGVNFTGTITAASVDCKNNQKQSTITVGDKEVIIKPGQTEADTVYGFTDLNLCGVFGSSPSYGTVQKRHGDPKAGNWLIGRSVEVRAKQLDATHFTLKGSSDYYVMGD